MSDSDFVRLSPDSPYYFFRPQNIDLRTEYDEGYKINEVFPINVTGIVTARDGFVIDSDKTELGKRLKDFRNPKITDDDIRSKYFKGRGASQYEDGDTRGWKLTKARKLAMNDFEWEKKVTKCLYRPFDVRFIYYADYMIDWPRLDVMPNMLAGKNIGLISARSNKSSDMNHFFCTRLMSETKCGESTTQSYLFPLYLYTSSSGTRQTELFSKPKVASGQDVNLAPDFLKALENKIHIKFSSASNSEGHFATFGAEDVFHYMYAVFHSPTYRSRYAEFLKIDFPRLPLTSNVALFRQLCGLGKELVSYHLLEVEGQKSKVKWVKGHSSIVAKGYPKYDDGKVYINAEAHFAGVPADVWEFHIGGYQVCEKWLKDRRERELSAEDIVHYGKVVSALGETIRIMAEVDEVIESAGGWPIK